MASPKNKDLKRTSTSESLPKIFLTPESDPMNDIDTYLSTHCTNEEQANEGSNDIDKENTMTTEQSEDNSDQALEESSKLVINNILKRLTSGKRKSPTRTDPAPSPEKVPKTEENTEIVIGSPILIDSSSDNSTIDYEYPDESFHSSFDKKTDIVSPIVKVEDFEEEIDEDQLTDIVNNENVLDQSGIVNNENEVDQSAPIKNEPDIIDLTDTPLSPRIKCVNWNTGLQLGKNNTPKNSNQKLNATSAKKDQASLDTPKKYIQTTLFGRNNAQNSLQITSVNKDKDGSPKAKEGNTTCVNEDKDGSPKAKEGNKQIQTKNVQATKELFSIFKTIKSFTNVLSSKEKQLLHKFENLNELQQYIVLKLYTRKKTWYHIVKFCEIVNMTRTTDTIDLFCELCKEEFIEYFTPNPDNMLELLEQLEQRKIKEIVNELNICSKSKTKKYMIECILEKTNTQTTLSKKSLKDAVMEKITKKLDKSIRIKDDIVEAFDNFCLLTLCPNSTFEDIQDYFRFYNEKNFPEAPLSDFPIFYSREKFLQYAEAKKLQNKLEIVCEFSNTEEKLEAINEVANEALSCLSDLKHNTEHENQPYLNRFTSAHVYSKILYICCEKLFAKKNDFSFQVKQWLEFLIQKFPFSRRLGKWYLKLIRLHMRHLKPISYDTAAKLLIEVLSTKQSYLGERIKYELECLAQSIKKSKTHKINKNDKEQLQTIIPSLIDASSIPSFTFKCPAISSNPIGTKRTYTDKCYDGVILSNVEALAMRKYSEEYPRGTHSEGSHIHSLLVLYFWDIIYNVEEDVGHVFISRLQNAPLDMFSEYFYENRKDAIDKRLREIDCEWSNEKLYEFGVSNWQEHSDKYSVFGTVQSVINSEEMVKDLFEAIGRKVLVKIFQRLIKNVAEYKSGMPDLLVWNTETKTHKFVEVKSENDRLAPHQTLWLVYLQEVGANVEICYVKDS